MTTNYHLLNSFCDIHFVFRNIWVSLICSVTADKGNRHPKSAGSKCGDFVANVVERFCGAGTYFVPDRYPDRVLLDA